MMLEGLNTGRPLLGIGKAKVRKGPRVQRKSKRKDNSADCGENECKTGCKSNKSDEKVSIGDKDTCNGHVVGSWNQDKESEDKESEGCGKVLDDEFSNLAINAEASDLF